MATYNVCNLFGPDHPEGPKTEREKAWLARNVLKAAPDVLALQEVQSRQVLDDWLDTHLCGRFLHRAFAPGMDPRQLGLAVISELPIGEIVIHPGFSREILQVRIGAWTIYTTHLKSRRSGPDANLIRADDAARLLQILEGDFLLLGDLNDTPSSSELQPLLRALSSAADCIPQHKRRSTWPARKPKRQIDYILFPKHLQERLVSCNVFIEARASDHCLLRAQFKQPIRTQTAENT